jgi:hypothetical protein
MGCSTASPPVPVLLFGTGEWNKRRSVTRNTRPKDISSDKIQEGESAGVDITWMSFDERLKYEGGKRFWEEDEKSEESRIPDGAPVTRVKDWSEVVKWAENYTETGM